MAVLHSCRRLARQNPSAYASCLAPALAGASRPLEVVYAERAIYALLLDRTLTFEGEAMAVSLAANWSATASYGLLVVAEAAAFPYVVAAADLYPAPRNVLDGRC